VKIEKRKNGKVKMYQRLLMQQILDTPRFSERTKGKNIPAVSRELIRRDLETTEMQTV